MNNNLLKDLISIPSYVDENNNEYALGEYLEKYINQNLPWLKTERQMIDNNRFNLIALGKDNPRIIFLSHMDTVLPTGDKDLSFKPFVKDFKLYGLGSADMKGGMAMAILAAQKNPRDDVALIFDCDEEYDFKGIEELKTKYCFKPKLLICPEPTNLEIINGCRGIFEIEFEVFGKTAHAGKPQEGINAIEKAVNIAKQLTNILSTKKSALGVTTVNLSALQGGRLCDNEIKIQPNAVPDIARIILDIRIADPNMTKSFVTDLIYKLGKKNIVNIRDLKFNIEYYPLLTDKKSLTSFEKVLQKSEIEITYKDISNCGFFESAIICKEWKCAGVIFGPTGEGHSLNESVDLISLEKTYSVFNALLSSPNSV